MDDLDAKVAAAIKEKWQKFGRLGGLARAKALTAKQRRAGALKASKAAAAARSKKAKQKKAPTQK